MAIEKSRQKPEKPYPDFPLFPHASGHWAKKCKGVMRYFGRWENWQEALDKWKAEKDDLMVGITPTKAEGYRVKDLVNDFLEAKRVKREAGELSEGMFAEYHITARRLVAAMGISRHVATLKPDDFATLRTELAKTLGPVSLGNEIVRVRSFFKYAAANAKIDTIVAFGSGFDRPSRKTIRKSRQAAEKRFLSAHEIRAMLAVANPSLKAMILLAVNTGAGNTDISELKLSHLDLDKGIMDYERPKTAVERRATLWPETVEALKTVIAARSKPSNPDHADRVFLTIYGNTWRRTQCREEERGTTKLHYTKIDSIGLEFGKLLRSIKVERGGKMETLKRMGVGFYALRHVFETVAGETKDQSAVDRIMGHADASMGGNYREWIKDAREDERLKRVTDHVHAWLYPKPPAKKKKK